MKELIIRTLSGIAFVFVIISSLITHELTFLFLFLLILIFSLNEYYNILYKLNYLPFKPISIIFAILIFTVNFLIASGKLSSDYLLVNLVSIPLFSFFPLFYDPKTFHMTWIPSLSGWLYILLPISLLPFIVFEAKSYHPGFLITIFIIIWVYDSMAYLSGTLLGKHRIFPQISPKKTWEGLIIGMVLTIGVMLLISKQFDLLSSQNAIFFSLTIIIAGTTGDFLESALKRNAGIKDSGIFLPGHGGFLDRFDSFIFSVFFAFIYYKIFIQ